MSIDTKAAEITEKLEKLAVSLGEDFLKGIGKREMIISLHGHEPEVLDFMKEKMDEYFKERGKEVVVHLNGKKDYAIDVGYNYRNIYL